MWIAASARASRRCRILDPGRRETGRSYPAHPDAAQRHHRTQESGLQRLYSLHLRFSWYGSVRMVGKQGFFRHRTILTAMCYLSAAVWLFITLRVSTVGACVAGLSATALFLYGGFGPYASIVLDLAPRNMRGAFAGFINTGGQIGGFVAPIAVGYIARDTGSFTGGLLFMVGGLLVAALCYLTLTPMSRAEKPRTAVPLLPCRVRPTCESRESHLERFASIQSLRCDPRPTMGQPSESGDGSDPRARNRP
jgi:MFS family permease